MRSPRASATAPDRRTGCSPWSEIGPALVNAGVSGLPFAGGTVGKQVWEASRGAFRLNATSGDVAGSLAGAAASGGGANCGCSK